MQYHTSMCSITVACAFSQSYLQYHSGMSTVCICIYIFVFLLCNFCARAGGYYLCLRAASGGGVAESKFAFAVHENVVAGGLSFRPVMDPCICVVRTHFLRLV